MLRVRPGEYVSVSDGRGAWRWARLAGDGSLQPASDVVRDPAIDPPLTVAFALVKGDRPELIVQKLTEIGIDRIVPFESARTVVRWRGPRAAHHLDRLRKVAREAAMQSRRVTIPEVTTVRVAAEVLADASMAIGDPDGSPPAPGLTAMAVGPEGGFTVEELGMSPRRIRLPGGVLRTETAAIVAGTLLANERSAR